MHHCMCKIHDQQLQLQCKYDVINHHRIEITVLQSVRCDHPCCNSSPSFASSSFTVPFKLLFNLQHLFVPWSLYSHNNVPLLTTEPSFTLNLTTTAFSGQLTTVTFAIIARVLYNCKHQVSKPTRIWTIDTIERLECSCYSSATKSVLSHKPQNTPCSFWSSVMTIVTVK